MMRFSLRRLAIRGAALGTLMLSQGSLLPAQGESGGIPRLRKQGTATQLVVDGTPFLILGGELGDSTASSVAGMRPMWAALKAMHLNTVVAPVYWELVEPEEGRYEFASVDSLVTDARANGMRLVLLWFGSWKNSMRGTSRATRITWRARARRSIRCRCSRTRH